jgi:hypothetical protein
VRLETEELRMMPVTARFIAQDFLRQQRLAPERDQTFGIEIFWVQCPEAHIRSETNSAGPREG